MSVAGIQLINLDYFSDPDGLLDCWHRGEYTFCYILEDKIDWYLYQLVGKDRPRRFRMLSRVDTVTLMYVHMRTYLVLDSSFPVRGQCEFRFTGFLLHANYNGLYFCVVSPLHELVK